MYKVSDLDEIFETLSLTREKEWDHLKVKISKSIKMVNDSLRYNLIMSNSVEPTNALSRVIIRKILIMMFMEFFVMTMQE